MTVAELDALDAAAAAEALASCCGARAWLAAVLAERPWRDADRLRECVDRAWSTLTPEQLDEAIAHHPRLGETRAAASVSDRASRWSATEQAGTAGAAEATRAALAAGNAEYEQRFGHVFILCAAGRSAEAMLAELRQRLTNDAATEQAVTARELHRITCLRIDRLLSGA